MVKLDIYKQADGMHDSSDMISYLVEGYST